MTRSNLIRHLSLAAMCLTASRPSGALCPSGSSDASDFRFVLPQLATPTHDALLVVMAEADTTVQVDMPACAISSTLTVGPGSPLSIPVCAGAQHLGNGVLGGHEIRVRELPPITSGLSVLIKSEGLNKSEDAYMVWPTNGTPSSYRPLAYRSGCVGAARFTVLAYENATEIQYADCNQNPLSVLLNSGESFQLLCNTSSEDMTGSLVHSTLGEPFFLAAGADIARLDVGSTCGTLVEQPMRALQPSSYASKYLVTEFNKALLAPPRWRGDVFRILATESNVDVSITSGGSVLPDSTSTRPCSGTSFNLALAGDWCDVAISEGAQILAANNKSILVQHLMRSTKVSQVGGIASMTVLPVRQLPCRHRFFSFGGYSYDPATTNGSYINVVAPSGQLDETLLDGVVLPAACVSYTRHDIPLTGYSWAKCLLPDPPASGAEHVVDGRSGTQDAYVGVYVYGQRGYTAYAYPAKYWFPF